MKILIVIKKNLKSSLKNFQFLPTKCPLCGGRVHNKDLIYQNKEIAKAVIQKGVANNKRRYDFV
ncbi:MAG TPA: hypothetical protein ENI29_00365 [bacterium]|nr:hypothetical protein [bacterium]